MRLWFVIRHPWLFLPMLPHETKIMALNQLNYRTANQKSALHLASSTSAEQIWGGLSSERTAEILFTSYLVYNIASSMIYLDWHFPTVRIISCITTSSDYPKAREGGQSRRGLFLNLSGPFFFKKKKKKNNFHIWYVRLANVV